MSPSSEQMQKYWDTEKHQNLEKIHTKKYAIHFTFLYLMSILKNIFKDIIFSSNVNFLDKEISVSYNERYNKNVCKQILHKYYFFGLILCPFLINTAVVYFI